MTTQDTTDIIAMKKTSSTQNLYPTKEEILANPPKNIKEDIMVLCDWKDENYKSWKEKSINQKLMALEDLIVSLCKIHKKPCRITAVEDRYFYDPNNKTINLSLNKPSIISTLHEFGHHIYGSSELKACAYSVWMFKMVFPKIFAKLEFKGHLIKEHVNTSQAS